MITSANAVTDSINRGRGTLGKLTNDPKAYDQLNAAIANLQEMTRRINAGEGRNIVVGDSGFVVV